MEKRLSEVIENHAESDAAKRKARLEKHATFFSSCMFSFNDINQRGLLEKRTRRRRENEEERFVERKEERKRKRKKWHRERENDKERERVCVCVERE